MGSGPVPPCVAAEVRESAAWTGADKGSGRCEAGADDQDSGPVPAGSEDNEDKGADSGSRRSGAGGCAGQGCGSGSGDQGSGGQGSAESGEGDSLPAGVEEAGQASAGAPGSCPLAAEVSGEGHGCAVPMGWPGPGGVGAQDSGALSGVADQDCHPRVSDCA
ncbi:MAG: hypothetical protein JWN52_5316 [Actinomycetia bacterium]|nr:hypothetical protein [Actinomycetes bacterium]